MAEPSELYQFSDPRSSFRVSNPERVSGLYFPLVNEAGLLSAITPDLQGDIKLDQHSFLNLPVVWEDLHVSRASRNFWVSVPSGRHWAVNGRSAWQRSLKRNEETVELEA